MTQTYSNKLQRRELMKDIGTSLVEIGTALAITTLPTLGLMCAGAAIEDPAYEVVRGDLVKLGTMYFGVVGFLSLGPIEQECRHLYSNIRALMRSPRTHTRTIE